MYYDIGRDKWKTFKRTFEEYLEGFLPFIELFNKDNCDNDAMIVFIHEKFYDKLNTKIKEETTNIKLISINEDFMKKLHCWKSLDKEKEIMNSEEFKKIIKDRNQCPECIYPKYTLINHSKIDLICWIINNKISDFNYYSWVDFGFFGKSREHIPKKLMNINEFMLDKVNIMLVKSINEKDKDIYYTLKEAPEKVGGFFFFGRKDKLIEFQKLYHSILYWFQYELKIADDDQHLMLRCYLKEPKLFETHCHYGWHKIFRLYEKS
jgi:hypothetical protein